MKNRTEINRDYYYKNLERLREKNRLYKIKWRKDNPVEARLMDKKKAVKYKEKRKAYAKIYAKTRKKDPVKLATRTILNNSVKLGKIKKPNKCEECKILCSPRAHHEDYTKPLEVIWLCTKCHALTHHPLPSKTKSPTSNNN